MTRRRAGLTETIVALDGIAVIVNAENPVSDLTLEQIASIYTGAVTDWSEFGSDAGAIAVIGRESAPVPVTASSLSPALSTVRAGPGAELYRRRDRGGPYHPRRHRLCLPLRPCRIRRASRS